MEPCRHPLIPVEAQDGPEIHAGPVDSNELLDRSHTFRQESIPVSELPRELQGTVFCLFEAANVPIG